MKAEGGTLFVGESGALVEDGRIEKMHTTKACVERGDLHSYLKRIIPARQMPARTYVEYKSRVFLLRAFSPSRISATGPGSQSPLAAHPRMRYRANQARR